MKIVLQRVKEASVSIDNQIVGQIKQGYLLLIAVKESDSQKEIDYLVHKIVKLRIFEDESGKMNRSIEDINGELLSVPQFTLYAETRKGNRPSFKTAANPDFANKIYQTFNKSLATSGLKVATGVFGADMKVSLINDGPVTIIFDTDEN